jgi:ubiquitin carboxyl-terminal hydrolase 7
VQLNVKGIADLHDSFKDYIQVEVLDGENKYQADGFGLQVAKKGVIFKKFPPVLHLQLKRFEYDMMKDSMVKINDRHQFPLKIQLDEFLEEKPQTPQVYHLYGVLVHAGDVNGGHYCAFLRRPELPADCKNPELHYSNRSEDSFMEITSESTANEEKSQSSWFKFDDDKVTNVTEKEALEDNYGGEIDSNSLKPLKYKRFTNAYMLIYYRESDLSEILSQITENDVPCHLSKSF